MIDPGAREPNVIGPSSEAYRPKGTHMSNGGGPRSASKSDRAVLATPTLNRGYRKILYLIAWRTPRIAAGCIFAMAIALLIFGLAGGQFIYMGERSAEAGPWAGSLLLVHPIDVADVRIGDALAISKGGGNGPNVLRRVLGADQSGRPLAALTLRDGSVYDVKVVTQADTRGRVLLAIPSLGARMTQAIGTLVLGGGMAVGLFAAYRWWRIRDQSEVTKVLVTKG